MPTASVKINLSNGEIEISGSEEFVERQLANLDDIISRINTKKIVRRESAPLPSMGEATEIDDVPDANQSENTLPDTFGEWLNRFPREINDNDKALVAAYFIQKQSDGNEFKTLEVNKILQDQGIKLTNPSTSIRRLASKKLSFSVRKDGKISYYRLSKSGEEHLFSLLPE